MGLKSIFCGSSSSYFTEPGAAEPDNEVAETDWGSEGLWTVMMKGQTDEFIAPKGSRLWQQIPINGGGTVKGFYTINSLTVFITLINLNILESHN